MKHNVFSTIIAVLISVTYRNVHQFTYTEQQAPDNSAVYKSLEVWVLSIDCTSYHHTGAENFEVVRRFLEKLWILAITYAHVGGEKSVLCLVSFFPAEVPLVTIRKPGWVPEPVRCGGEQGNSFPSWGSYRGHPACC